MRDTSHFHMYQCAQGAAESGASLTTAGEAFRTNLIDILSAVLNVAKERCVHMYLSDDLSARLVVKFEGLVCTCKSLYLNDTAAPHIKTLHAEYIILRA